MADRAGDISQGFTEVDQTADPRFFIDFLDARKTIDGEREVKQAIREMLDIQSGATVLDVGCGTGDDAREMAARVAPGGQVIGVDVSGVLVAESQRRTSDSNLPIQFLRGDVRKLNFPDAAFDRVRTDRVLIFVPEVEIAVAEMVRVLRPGGRLVVSELDHELRFVDSRLPEINQKMHRAWVASNPQPCLGRQLNRLLADHGLRNVRSAAQVIQLPYKMFKLVTGGFLRAAIARGELVQAEADAWLADIAELADAGLFTNGTVVFTARGEKPE
jgi:ubiquinone/menaquinone biosynthesis C-methylase UbiE